MAINFLNAVNLNKNQLEQAVIQNLSTDPASGEVGQIIFNTVDDTLKQYVANAGSGSPGWVEVGSTSVVAGTGIGVTFNGGEAVVRNTGLVTVLDGTYIDLTKQGGGDNTQLTADLSAVDGTSVLGTRFLSKDNTWDVPAFDQYTHWTLAGDNVTTQNISSEDTATFEGGTYITTAVSATDTLTINHDLTTRTDTTSTLSAVSFPVVDSVTTNSTGHVTAVNVKTVTVPDVTTYDLTTAPTGTAVRLTGNLTGVDDVTISGTTGQTAMSRISASELRVALTNDVTITNNLTVVNDVTAGGNLSVTGTGSFTDEVTVPTATVGTSAPNLAQVELLVAGVGVFQGSYNAATNTPALEGGSNVALDQGDYFVVSVSGSFLGEALEPGDFIFANNAIAANSTPALSNYTVVQADDNIAGAGATDGATQKGVSGFDSENFKVSTNGWVQLKPQSNPYAQKIALTGGVDSGGETTFTVNIVTMFGAGALAANCIATVKETVSSLIVYPEVTGNGTGSLDFKFIPVVSTSAGFYTAYITYI